MLTEYAPVIVFAMVGVGFGMLPLLFGALLAPKRKVLDKLLPYECGFDAFENARMKFDVRYYLVAILFIIFDLEIVFLFPWAVEIKQLPSFAMITMAIFLTVLVVGFVYEWKKGALEWE